MEKINKKDILKIVLVLFFIAGISLSVAAVGRFTPTHKIVEPVACVSCHPEQAVELTETTHLAHFAGAVYEIASENGKNISAAEATSGGCTMCHNYWENMKWFGVANVNMSSYERDFPATIIDIYGNDISPYGLASTEAFMLNMSEDVVAWKPGLDVYKYTEGNDTYYRTDYIWSMLSSVSPGPVAVQYLNDSGVAGSCGTAEKGLCHIAEQAVGMSAADKKQEFSDYNKTAHGAGVFFTHEMAYTTAQYAAKPVKLCAACHVFKVPPMKWGGEPWYGDDVKAASGLLASGDPFGLEFAYDMTGEIDFDRPIKGVGDFNYNILYKTPDWAHQIVPCMRCHVHAGINGESVSSNEPTIIP